MIHMTTAIIFAGGESKRMGQDKSLMFGGVERLVAECEKSSISRIIILCGDKSRLSLFDGEIWADPEDCHSIVDVVKWSVKHISDDILLIPCDAFNLNSEGIELLCRQKNCVAVDSKGIRQPLLCRITNRQLINWSGDSINSMLDGLPSFSKPKIAKQFDNFNQSSDLRNHLSQRHQ